MAKNVENDESSDGLFISFRKKPKLFKKLITGIRDVERGFSSMNVRCLKISLSNAMFGECFSKALCYTELQGDHFVIGAIFRNGLNVLKQFIESTDNLQDIEAATKNALECLILFFLDGEPTEDFFRSRKFSSEVEWAVVVAQHLLSKLAGKTYIVDHHYQDKGLLISDEGIDDVCPCDEHDKMAGAFGDTSFGCENGWHGSADLLIGNVSVRIKTPTTIPEEADRSSVISDSSDPSDESTRLSEDDKMQLISQCIVHSFLQRKYDKTLKNCLIPTIGMSRKNVSIVFYDCENDILLTTAQLDLEDTDTLGELRPAMIVLLWLTLNYQLFSTGVPSSKLQNKANFGDFVSDKMERYKENVKRGIASVEETECHDEWADVPGDLCIEDEKE